MRRLMWMSRLLTMTCLLSLASCGLTVGPTVKTQIVILHPGKPMTLTQNKSIEGIALEGQTPVKQDVGGWVAMPPEHWEAIKRKMKQMKLDIAE